MLHLGEGSVLAGMLLGTIAVFVIDRRFYRSAIACGAGAVLTLVGLIHGPKVHLFESPKIALGYAFAGVVCLGYAQLKVAPRDPDPLDAIDMEDHMLSMAPSEERVAVPA